MMNSEVSAIVMNRKVSATEKLLLPVALLLGILFDRLMFAPILRDYEMIRMLSGMFWLIWIVIFYTVYWQLLHRNKALWYGAINAAALCVWNILFAGSDNSEYAFLTYLVLPGVLMTHAQMAAGGYSFTDIEKIVAAWFAGWVIKPFTGLPALFTAANSLMAKGNKTVAKRIAVSVFITLLLFSVIVPLLSGADQMFGYHIDRLFADWNISSFVGHSIVAIVFFGLFYSFMWNIGFEEKTPVAEPKKLSIDTIICGFVLTSVTLLYALFCAIQFTYLFAGAGLPEGMTYSEYAREGFAQTVIVCFVNLLIFGVFLRFGARNKFITGLLCLLLALTGVMLFSGAVRLNLYIVAYGLTWLRLLSAWFILYLTVVILLSAVRMIKEKLPVIAMSAMILLGWYVALGYVNPDSLIEWYNYTYNYISLAQ